MDDILENSGDPKKKAKLIEGYKFSLSQEMIQDFGKAFGCPKETIIAFVNQEVKHEGKCEKCWIMKMEILWKKTILYFLCLKINDDEAKFEIWFVIKYI